MADIRILRPRPSTFVWRSLVDDLLGGSSTAGAGGCTVCGGFGASPIGGKVGFSSMS